MRPTSLSRMMWPIFSVELLVGSKGQLRHVLTGHGCAEAAAAEGGDAVTPMDGSPPHLHGGPSQVDPSPEVGRLLEPKSERVFEFGDPLCDTAFRSLQRHV